MKKNLVALLLVLAVVSVGLFAGPTVNFNVVTNVPAIGEIKITRWTVRSGACQEE